MISFLQDTKNDFLFKKRRCKNNFFLNRVNDALTFYIFIEFNKSKSHLFEVDRDLICLKKNDFFVFFVLKSSHYRLNLRNWHLYNIWNDVHSNDDRWKYLARFILRIMIVWWKKFQTLFLNNRSRSNFDFAILLNNLDTRQYNFISTKRDWFCIDIVETS
jgi:hypothetical protein